MDEFDHISPDEQVRRIRELNDAFRRTFQGGRVLMTAGVRSFSESTCAAILQRVRSFCSFSEANDPHGEHDFGSFEHAGQTIFWKIDCYDERLAFGSEDPSDPTKTTRVLTIMLAEEY